METEWCEFFDFKDPNPDQNFAISNIPTKLSFRNSEFWQVYFDSLDKAFYRPWKTFEFGFKEISECGYWTEIDWRTNVSVWWNGTGIDLIIGEKDDSNGFLKKIWSLKQNVFKDRYGNDRVEFEHLTGEPSKIKIKYFNRPLEWLLIASPEEKIAIANALSEEFWELRYLFTNNYHECKELVRWNSVY